MDRVTCFREGNSLIGLQTRKQTEGVELKLVEDFIQYYTQIFLRNNRKKNLAIFVEPKMASGFPDVVFASYQPDSFQNWSEARKKLCADDLRVLSYLMHARQAKGASVIKKLRMDGSAVVTSLEKLHSADLIRLNNGLWRPNRTQDYFGITKLVSVEAKIGSPAKAMSQSLVNTWFASHSFALLDAAAPQTQTQRAFRERGIGIYCRGDQFYKAVDAQRLPLPSSYQSLLFNEWIGNSIHAQS